MAQGNPRFRQSSFADGEASPLMLGRNDFKKYASSLRSSKNWLITQHGALHKRPGTKFIAEAKDSSQKVRLVPFTFSNVQALVLEFGAGYVRFYQNGQRLMIGPAPVEVATPYAADDLFKLKFAQSGDVVTICHQSYPPMDLSRLSLDGTAWSLALTPLRPFEETFASPLFPFCPLQLSMPYSVFFVSPGVVSTDPQTKWSYAVTAVYDDGSESLPSWTNEVSVDRTAATKPTIGFYVNTAGFKQPSYFKIYCGRGGVWGFLDTVDGNGTGGGHYVDAGEGPDFAQVPPTYPAPFHAAVGGWAQGSFVGVGRRVFANGNTYEAVSPGTCGSANGPAQTAGISVDGAGAYPAGDTAVAGSYYFFNGAVWKAVNEGPIPALGVQAPVAVLWGDTITDGAGITWKHVSSGGLAKWKFVQAGAALSEYPAVVTYQGQRRIFANVVKDPTKIVGTEIGKYKSFNVQNVPLDTDAIDFSLSSQRYEEIRSFVNLKYLLALTSERDWTITGGNGTGAITPAGVMAQPNNVRGASWLDPIVAGVSGLYVQALGTQVWELVFDFYTQSYLGRDVTIIAQHLFQRHQIVDWSYAPVPYSIVWAVREDGVLLGFTYVREEEVRAWHHHVTGGGDDKFESVCAIPETVDGVAESGVYVVVRRQNNDGSWRRNIERFATRQLPLIYNADGDLVIDSSKGVFLDAAVVGAGKVISGLDHLEGMAVTVLADGAVLANRHIVTDGQIDISDECVDTVPATVIVGIPYLSDIEMLPIAPADAQSIRQNFKNVYRVGLELVDTRGMSAGPDFGCLTTWDDQRNVLDGFGNVAPFTGLEYLDLVSSFERDGAVVIRHSDPLPATIVAIERNVNVGGD